MMQINNHNKLVRSLVLLLLLGSCFLFTAVLSYPSRPPKIPQTNPLVPTLYSRYGRKHNYNRNQATTIKTAAGLVTAKTYIYGLYNVNNNLYVTVDGPDNFSFRVNREPKDPKNRLKIGNKNLGGFFKFKFLDDARPNFSTTFLLTYNTNVKRKPDDVVGVVMYNYTSSQYTEIPSVQLSDTAIQATVDNQLVQSFFYPKRSDHSELIIAFTSGVGREKAGDPKKDYSAASSLLSSPIKLLGQIVLLQSLLIAAFVFM